MLPSKNLTIYIVTYKRPQHLGLCLKSIQNQKSKIFETVIIDNDYQKTAYPVFLKFRNKINLKYENQPSKNISKCRNLAIKICQTRYLAFIDDDCILLKNWSENAFLLIKNEQKYTFFQGSVCHKYQTNKLIDAQIINYKNWIKSNIKKNTYCPEGLDTKNIIFDLNIINKYKIKFDENLPIFEDIDFGLSLQKHNLRGKYVPQLSVNHPDIRDLKTLVRKYFYRGKVKYCLNQKWLNYDKFSPNLINDIKNIFKHPSRVYQYLLSLSFNLGFLVAKIQKYQANKNKIFIVNCLDHGANQERAMALSKFLEENGFRTEIINSQATFDLSTKSFSNFFRFPILYTSYRSIRILIFKFKLTVLKPYLFYLELILRPKIIHRTLCQKTANIVIFQYPNDIISNKSSGKFKQIFDVPTIYSEEIKNIPGLPEFIINKIKQKEKQVFEDPKNHICFHWYSLLKLAQKINIKPKNSFILNWGCYPHKNIAKYNQRPKVIYLGNLNSPWINPHLLESTQNHLSATVDIYSYEKPDHHIYSTLKYSGFLKDLDLISTYQFGLITFTENLLRNNGFSAKQLMYFSYGIPVLCPVWRHDKLLKPATIYYHDKESLRQQIIKYSDKKLWLKKHQAALKIAHKLQWDLTLKPIIQIIYKLQHDI